MLVAHNTCVGNKDGLTFREQGPRPLDTPDGRIPYHCTGNVVTGNLCAGNRGYQLGLWYDNAHFGWHPGERGQYRSLADYDTAMAAQPELRFDPLKVGLTIDRNWYAPAAGQKLCLYGVPWRPRFLEFGDLAAFTAKTGFDARSRVGEPGFQDAAKGDWRLRADSPARAVGAGWAQAPATW